MWPDAIGRWHQGSNNIVVLAAKDENALDALDAFSEIPHHAVKEPDLDNEITAIAFVPVPGAERHLASLPLLGKEAALASK